MSEKTINSGFWRDDYIEDLNTDEKTLFLYLLTNEYSNVIGIYEISTIFMAIDTEIKREKVIEILNKFQKDDKIYFLNRKWIGIKDIFKYTKKFGGPKMEIAIANILKKVPSEIIKIVLGDNYKIKLPNEHGRSKISNSLRMRVLQRDKYRCQICGKTSKNTELQIDHIIPISKGGSNKFDNLRVLCMKCNTGRNNEGVK